MERGTVAPAHPPNLGWARTLPAAGPIHCEKVSSKRNRTHGPGWPLPRKLRHSWEHASGENSDPYPPFIQEYADTAQEGGDARCELSQGL